MDGPRFCLDVGTRKVCGILAEGRPGSARVLHWCVREHPGRAMRDAQVQSVERVAATVAEVKARLEEASGASLQGAHVAVAGGVLAVARAAVRLRVGHGRPLERADVAAMELQAVREARASLGPAARPGEAHCVGYSVLERGLDGRPLAQLEGHRGSEAALEVLATFLPRPSLESLLEVLRRAGLRAESLTLEPIAAVQFMVPDDLRRLNLALIDVGAGTSDIAVTRDGRAEAFAMVPLAGDEATERLSEAFVLDFAAAEELKRSAWGGPGVPDIFGNPRPLDAARIEEALDPARRRWAEACAEALLGLNRGAAPQAVILAGGGSLLPGLPAALARALGMDPARVGHRPLPTQETFLALPTGLLEPWAVTPLGIAASALANRGLPFQRFEINGAAHEVPRLRAEFTGLDALMELGAGRRRFHGRPGQGLAYTFNGAERTLRGGAGAACRLFLEGRAVALDAPLPDGAVLTFVEAADGADASLSLAEALQREGLLGGAFRFNGEERPLPIEVRVDGRPESDLASPVRDRARLEVPAGATLRGALRAEGVDVEGLIQGWVRVRAEGSERVLPRRNYHLRLNGADADLDARLAAGDRVEFEAAGDQAPRVRDLWGSGAPRREPPAPPSGALRVLLNGAWAPLDTLERVRVDGREAAPDDPLSDGAVVEVERGGPCGSVGEALPRLGLGPWVRAGRLRVLLNGRPAGPEEPLSHDDALDLSLVGGPGAG